MKVFLELETEIYSSLISHLLPEEDTREHAAFLFAHQTIRDGSIKFEVCDSYKAKQTDFAAQLSDYLELSDETRKWLIKKAHKLNASLIEMHSHPMPWPAAFSLSDRIGLKETVSHMWWRLKNRPYIAIVVAPSGFDALVWMDNPRVPRPLDALLVDNKVLKPTNNSLEGWQ